MVVRGDSAWSWTIENGVIDLIQGEPELLQTRIARFMWDTTHAIQLALSNLVQVPEITREDRGNFVWMGGLGVIPIGTRPPPPPPDPREVRDVTMQSALNRIVSSFGSDGWSYRESMCSGTRTFVLAAVVQGPRH
jgi:hypothetical protein